ncbi:MAG: OsmC family protein [Gemmatimonadota bacterium]|nr:OsmC family protein [Gemmatimonadota bacterium]
MSEYTATIAWQRDGAEFTDNRYSRKHRWLFDGGVEVPASASPHSVPEPLSVAAAVDPEEAFVAAISSCHMLWFLSLTAKKGFVVDDYRDDAIGTMGRNPKGRIVVAKVRLRPLVSFAGAKQPTSVELTALHHEAHEACYIANSVTTIVVCEPVYAAAPN